MSEQSEEDDEDLMDEEDESGFSRFTANIHICQRGNFESLLKSQTVLLDLKIRPKFGHNAYCQSIAH